MDVTLILEKLESLNFIRLHKQVGEYYQVYCPIHNNGQEKKPSCGILINEQYKNKQKYPAGWVHCFSCSYVNTLPGLVTDLLKAKNISKNGLEWLHENIPGFIAGAEFDYLVPQDLMINLNDQFAVQYIQSIVKPKQNYISEEELIKYRYTVDYMYQRKLTDQIIEMFDVGFDKDWAASGRTQITPCLTFPVRDISGNTLYIYRRSVETKFFSMPEGLQKPVYGLYELHKYFPNCKSVIICESIIDALTCWVYGKPAVALMSTGNSYQIDQLRSLGIKEFILGFDGDAAGQTATRKWKKALKDVAIVWSMKLPENRDINNLELSGFNAIYDAKE